MSITLLNDQQISTKISISSVNKHTANTINNMLMLYQNFAHKLLNNQAFAVLAGLPALTLEPSEVFHMAVCMLLSVKPSGIAGLGLRGSRPP